MQKSNQSYRDRILIELSRLNREPIEYLINTSIDRKSSLFLFMLSLNNDLSSYNILRQLEIRKGDWYTILKKTINFLENE